MHRAFIAPFLAVSFALASSTHAVTIATAVSGGDASNPVSDADGPVNSGEVFSEVIIPTDAFSNMTARAIVDIDGNSAVDLDGVYITSAKPHVTGIPFPQVTDGTTSWTASATNNSAVPTSYRYRFLLHPIRIALFSYAGYSDSDPIAPVASYGVEVRANNVLVFESHATLRGGSISHVLTESGTDLGGVLTIDEKSGTIYYDFAQFQATLGIGTVLPGESITVEAKLIAHTEAHIENSGGTASLGDPLDLKDDPGVSAVLFSIAPPLPVTLLALNDVAQTSGVDELVRILDPTAGDGTLVGSLGNGFLESEAMTVLSDPQGLDRIFVVDNDRLLELDPATGNGTLIGPIGFSDVDGIAFHPTTGVLYGVTHTSHELIRIDITTGAGTLVADNFIASRRCNDIAFHPDGNCYVLTDGSPRIYRIDVATGAKLQQWNLTGATSLEALSWSPDGNTLYSAGDRGSFKDLVWIDLATSEANFVSLLPSGFRDIEALAWVSAAIDQLLSQWGTPSDAPAPRVAVRLHPNVPNPFNPTTTLTYDLEVAGTAELVVTDVAGREIATLAAGPHAAGRHHAVWDGRNAAGLAVASGVYIARLRAGSHSSAQRLVLVR